MYERYKGFILLLCAIRSAAVNLDLRNCTQLNNASISEPLVEECPANSQCMSVNSSLKCICLPEFQHNVITQPLSSLEHKLLPYCQQKNASDELIAKSKVTFYIRSPAKAEHLVSAILLVLLAVISAVSLIYIIKLMKPLKRTKIAYVKLKRRSNKHNILEEEEVYEGVAMTRRVGDSQCY